jgi:hypothetical protein
MMRTEGALALLTTLRPEDSDIATELGQRGDAAYLRITLPPNPDRFAVVNSPGDRWFSLDVDRGFSLNHFEEDTPDEDVARLFRRYIDVGLGYLRQDPIPIRTRLLRLQVITVSLDEGDVVLGRSLAYHLKGLTRLGKRR